MRLFIAEKPSLARAIADVLPKPHQRGMVLLNAVMAKRSHGALVTFLNRLSPMLMSHAMRVGICKTCQLFLKSGS